MRVKLKEINEMKRIALNSGLGKEQFSLNVASICLNVIGLLTLWTTLYALATLIEILHY